MCVLGEEGRGGGGGGSHSSVVSQCMKIGYTEFTVYTHGC